MRSYALLLAAALLGGCVADTLDLSFDDLAADARLGETVPDDDYDPDTDPFDPEIDVYSDEAEGEPESPDELDPEADIDEDYIVGGSNVTGNRYRSLVAFLWPGAGSSRICSATVLSRAGNRGRYLLTAAHCVARTGADGRLFSDPAPNPVTYVTSQRQFRFDQFPPSAYGVARVVMDPTWSRCRGGCAIGELPLRGVRDVAIIELTADVQGARSTRVARASVGDQQRDVSVAGYGLTNLAQRGNPAVTARARFRKMRAVRLPATLFGQRLTNQQRNQFMYFEGARGAVNGDSGGPVYDGNTETVIGINSSYLSQGNRLVATFASQINHQWVGNVVR